MRILFTFAGGRGHFEPLVPIARAANAAGHSVAFGCGPSLIQDVEAAGFNTFAMGRGTSATPERIPLRPIDSAREERDLRERFARLGARYRMPLITSLCDEWQPDVVVCDETDFGAQIAAERLGLPFATVLVIAAGSFVRGEVVGEALNELRAEHDLPADPEFEMLSRYLVLSPFPPSYRDPNYPLPITAHSFNPSMLAPGGSPTPEWSTVLPDAPTIYFTLGTVFNMESGDLLSRAIAGLRELPCNLIATVGNDIDPQEFGPQPAHVRIECYIPQASVLPHCDLVVSHAGSGSVMGALTHGLPSLLIPIGADQPSNAKRCAELRVAQVLDAMHVTPERIQATASAVLDDPGYRRNAEDLRNEIAALPPASDAIGLLENLAAERKPIR